MRETDAAVGGIELTYLTEEEQKAVLNNLKNNEVISDFVTKVEFKPENSSYNPAWSRAWRRYNKDKFVVDTPRL